MREGRARGTEERLDLPRRQVDPEGQAGLGRIPEEGVPEALVCEQPAEGPFHIPLAHPVLLVVLYRHGRGDREPRQGQALSWLPHSPTGPRPDQQAHEHHAQVKPKDQADPGP